MNNHHLAKYLTIASIAREIIEAENLPHKIALKEAKAELTICLIESCGQGIFARGYCKKHYNKLRNHGDPLAGNSRSHRQIGQCTISGCEKPKKNRGYCSTHYSRFLKHGDPLYRKTMNLTGQCSYNGCKNPDFCRSYCQKHYYALMRSGELKVVQPRTVKSPELQIDSI